MFNYLARKLIEAIESYCHRNKKELHICGTGGPDDIYMIRYPVLATKYLTIYVHRFLRSDVDDHHDHPFNFWSYVASGGYTEELLDPATKGSYPGIFGRENAFHTISDRREPGSLAYRKGEAVHRVIVDNELKYADRAKAPLTIIFLGKRFREWGFWKKADPRHGHGVRFFVPWYTYLGVDPNSEKARKHQ